jgi:hypothetical protein
MNKPLWNPGAWEHVIDLVPSGDPLFIGGAFTDPAAIERMKEQLRRRRMPPTPRSYYPSIKAHRPS